MTDTPKALTVEEEAELRSSAMLMDSVYPMRGREDLHANIEDVWALVDSARAEAERLRQERDAYAVQAHARGKASLSMSALAAELAERLADMVARYGDFAPGQPFEFPPDHHIPRARAALSKARALGIGSAPAPKSGKGAGPARYCMECETVYRGDGTHVCPAEGEKGEPNG